MKNWKNFSALKSVKREIESLSTAMGSALEAVIVTPIDENKDIKPLLEFVREFSTIPGTLDLLEFTYLSLLANEILQLLNNTLNSEATLDNKELELRLESAFVAVTDLPALLEYSLNNSHDEFIFVCQHLNRLRKSRACAIVFSSAPLIEKRDVDFRSRYKQQPEKMQEILAKQSEIFVRYSAALRKNPEDPRALKLLATVTNNLELMLRDHKIGVLWGLGSALVEVFETANSDKQALATCLLGLVPYARKLIEMNTEALQDSIDEALLERIVNIIAGADVTSGRPGIIKLWYSLDMASSKEFRAEYRRLQVRYYNKGALNKGLQLIKENISTLIDFINTQAEASELNRQSVTQVFSSISSLNNVVRVLRMHYLADSIEESLRVEPVGNLEEALYQAAGVLFRMNKEVCNKIDSMEREVFNTDRGITSAESINSGHLQILKTAKISLETVIAALDQHVDVLRMKDGDNDQPLTNPEHLQQAHRTLDELACVLHTLQLTSQAESLTSARDYIAWLLNQPAAQDLDTNFHVLSYLLINSLWYLEQLAMGREETTSGSQSLAAENAALLESFLASVPPETHDRKPEKIPEQEIHHHGSNRLSVVPNETGTKEPAQAPEPELSDANAVTSESSEVAIQTDVAPKSEATPLTKEATKAEVVPQATKSADDEIKDIFAEEFDEVLETLRTDHASLTTNPFQPESIKDCRRHFHTLKGSGRMVGATVISTLAELMEKAYDHAGNNIDGLNAEVLDLTARCIAILPGLKTDFCYSADSATGEAIIEPLCREARAILAGEAFSPEVSIPLAITPVVVHEIIPDEAREEAQAEVQEIASVDFQPEIESARAETAQPENNPAAATAPVKAVQEEKIDETLLAVFLEEADDLLQSLDTLFLKWQGNPMDKSCVAEYLRLLHTMKGSAALVCEHELSKAAHDHETYILDAKKNQRALDNAFFVECDRRIQVMQNLRRLYERDDNGHFTRTSSNTLEISAPISHVEPASQPEYLTGDLDVVSVHEASTQETLAASLATKATTLPKAEQQNSPAPSLPSQPAVDPVEKPQHEGQSAQQQDNSAPAPDELVRVSSKLLRSLLNDADEINFSRSRIENSFHDIGTLLSDMDETLNRFLAYVKDFEQKAGARQKLSDAIIEENNYSHSKDFDALEMDRYTELQQLSLSMTEDYNDLQDIRINLANKVKEINNILTGQQRLTNSLQDGLISSQMVPFASVIPRLGRLVRQISGTLKKQVNFEVQNQQGSLDKNILQAIITPLEHIIRNAIDHGIETAETRITSGKKDVATLKISASRQGASFVIRISDDGQGINVEKVMQLARNKGLLEEGAVLRNEDAYRLLFQSGFSTSASVSNISGRGVGLDVVRSEIEHIGGAVEIESALGIGTTFIITLPLTSSLNRALLFEIQETRYVVLMNTLDGVLVEKLANIHQKQQQQLNPGFEYGGKTYEYLYLGKLINESFKPKLDSIDNSIPLLLVSSQGKNIALHIDSIIESRDLVVKSIGQQFASIPGIAGGVIMPDGNVAIVLELKALVSLYGKEPIIPAAVPISFDANESTGNPRKLIMVVDDSITVRKVTSTMLKRNGMDVLTAKNGLEAVDLLEHTKPDVILLDIEMPKMDGFEFATHVRAQPKPICDIPIIMITSRTGDKHRTRAESIGVNQYLCKPFEEANLLEYIRSY